MGKKKLYYGWIVVLAAFLCNFASTGLMIYSFSLFVVPMSEALVVPRTSIALASSVFTICMGLVSAYVGPQVAKGRIKLLIGIGIALLGAGNLILSVTGSVTVFYICYVMLGVGSAFTGPAITSTLATAWFDKKRGLASGIISCGASICAIVMPSVLASIMGAVGVRGAYRANSIIVFVLLGIAMFLVKTKPQDIGLLPDGELLAEKKKDAVKKTVAYRGLTRKEALRTPAFWLILIAFSMLGFGQIGVMQNAAAYLTDLQFGMTTIASALGFIGFAGAVSTILCGWLADKFNPKLVFCLGNLLLMTATLVLMFTKTGDPYSRLVIYALCFGVGMGIWASSVPVIITRLLGPKYFGTIWGVAFAIRSICGDTLGVPAVAKIAEVANYKIAFLIAAIIFVISAVLMSVAKRPQIYEKIAE